MVNKLAVIGIWAEDVPAATHFYHDVVGLRLTDQHGDRPHFDLDGIYLTILKGRPMPAHDATPSHFPIIAFAVDDLDIAVARLRAHKVELPWGIENGVVSRWVKFHDSAGNLVELVQFE
jgi:catechol 2,3-dioxygenase-like lactoylglutathione lyase family enzyme